MRRFAFPTISIVLTAIFAFACAFSSPLIKAAHEGDVKQVKELLKAGSDVNMRGGSRSETALYTAAAQGQLDVVKSLLDHGAEINLLTDDGDSALMGATWGCHDKVAITLIAHGADVTFQNRTDGSSALLHAVACGDLSLVKSLLGGGADVNLKTRTGITPLLSAVWQNNPVLTEILLGAGADINTSWNDGGSALYEAAANGYDAVVKLLIKNGANLNSTSSHVGWTPLFIAVAENHYSATAMLIGAGADINVVDNSGFTPLLMAAYNGNAPIAKALCAKGAGVNVQDVNGWTPLQYAIYYQHESIVAVLLTHGAITAITNKDGHDALWYAEKSRNQSIIHMIKDPNSEFTTALAANIQTGSSAFKGNRIDNATIELVRTAKPLQVSYKDIVINPLETTKKVDAKYLEAAERCRQSIIADLRDKEVFNVLETAAGSAGKTLLVDVLVEDMRIPKKALRIVFGPMMGQPFMNVRVRLTDALSNSMIHEMGISTNSNAWFAGVTMGTTDAYLPVEMGKIIGEYLFTIIPSMPVDKQPADLGSNG